MIRRIRTRLPTRADLDPGAFTGYNWFKNELTLNYTQQVLTATSQGKYRVDITNSYGCVAPDETEIKNECIPKIEAPNAFRPGSTVTRTTISMYSHSLSKMITSRYSFTTGWGELVYTSSDRHFKWNGGFNNSASQPLPGGSLCVYYTLYERVPSGARSVGEARGSGFIAVGSGNKS
ncbi:MAG: hypothetical protein WDN75_20700 [Bacteroidota bacterium]